MISADSRRRSLPPVSVSERAAALVPLMAFDGNQPFESWAGTTQNWRDVMYHFGQLMAASGLQTVLLMALAGALLIGVIIWFIRH